MSTEREWPYEVELRVARAIVGARFDGQNVEPRFGDLLSARAALNEITKPLEALVKQWQAEARAERDEADSTIAGGTMVSAARAEELEDCADELSRLLRGES